MLGEWVIVTPSRAGRPFQDKKRECPFCPGGPETSGEWEVLTLDNRYASLSPECEHITPDDTIVMETCGFGYCRVILHSRDHNRQFEDMTDHQLLNVMREYARVFKELDNKENIRYVLEFENRGKSIGVSLNHPHAQVYALPFIPPRIERETGQFERFWKNEHKCLVCELTEKELKSRDRVVHETEHFVSVVPFGARLPYEVHIYPKSHAPSLLELEGRLLDLGQIIRDTTTRYSKVFKEIAYVMALHTRPSAGDNPYWHFHIEFYPPWRDRSRLKYLAGIESGAWTYTNDSTPEEKARELREAL
jgi:UDPglucose--hexose-1-phosphate uridylyltransferase